MLIDHDQIGWTGRIRITHRNLAGDIIHIAEFDNLITNAGLNAVAAALRGDGTSIRYLAVGDDNTAPVVGDTTLGNETSRKQITSQSNPAGVGNTITSTYLGPSDAVGTIEELGWFAGLFALEEPDSGILIARTLYSHTKTDTESIQIDRTDTFS